MFFNKNPFFACCICNKLQHSSNNFKPDWKNETCGHCKTKLIVYKKQKVIFNFNENMYLATCICNKTKFLKNRIIDDWYSRDCSSCKTKVRVYNDKHMEIKQDKNPKKIFSCSCECGQLCYDANLINLKWPEERCNKCNTKLIVKDNKDRVIVNFNFESFNIKSECLFTSVCSCGTLHYQCNYILKKWKNKTCDLCKSNLIVYHSLRKIKIVDYNFETCKNFDEYLDKMESIKFCSLAELENQYKFLYDE